MIAINSKIRGFSLLELVIVLLILGLLLAGALGPLSTKYEQRQREQTKANLELIRESLIGHALTTGRLPCPDTDGDGEENLLGTDGNRTCAVVTNFVSAGNVPWLTLGVPQFDEWREGFVYAVTSNFADDIAGAAKTGVTNGSCGTATLGVSFELCSVGQLNVVSAATGGTEVVKEIPALVLSTGNHGTSSLASEQSADEQENFNNDDTFVYRDLSMQTGEEFDDLMVWISPNVLKYRMVQAGRLP